MLCKWIVQLLAYKLNVGLRHKVQFKQITLCYYLLVYTRHLEATIHLIRFVIYFSTFKFIM